MILSDDMCGCLSSVVNELEGLARGGKAPGATSVGSADAARHAQHVAECAGAALNFLKGRQPGVRCVTTRGTVLTSTTCTMEEDSGEQVTYVNVISP